MVARRNVPVFPRIFPLCPLGAGSGGKSTTPFLAAARGRRAATYSLVGDTNGKAR